MLDFVSISTRSPRKDLVEIYPKFIIKKTKDLMVRGGDFYAIWDEEAGFWCTDPYMAIQLIDRELKEFYEQNKDKFSGIVKVMYLWDSSTGTIDKWWHYVKKQCRDYFVELDTRLIFSNEEVRKNDYASMQLSYPIEDGATPGYDRLMSILYDENNRHKIEWVIGSIVAGASVSLQKFMVLYGSAGTGKSTVINIMEQLFEGYYATFDSKALGSASNAFALESFKSNPLVALEHDGDLSRIQDNTRLNSLVSHEHMVINEKFKSSYMTRFRSFLIMGTNKPVRITDSKSGLIRRLIDVSPTGNKIPYKEYKNCVNSIKFELGAIANHCKEVFLEDTEAYNDYVPIAMFSATNDIYNFMSENYLWIKDKGCVGVMTLWGMYGTYCGHANVQVKETLRAFREELKDYFYEFHKSYTPPGERPIKDCLRFPRADKFGFEDDVVVESGTEEVAPRFVFGDFDSIFDAECGDCYAQYANKHETPSLPWEKVKTKLGELNTERLHYVRLPKQHIVIDFDLKNEKGEKDFELNLRAIQSWPETYAEISKGGNGIHLHYIYEGDVEKLSSLFDKDIEIKTSVGKSSLRRKLSKCNNVAIAKLSVGLPLKGEKMIGTDVVINEKVIRVLIARNLQKEYHPATKPSVDFIKKILDDAFDAGVKYDVSDLRAQVSIFAAGSTNQSDYCTKLVNEMKFKSEEASAPIKDEDKPIIFFDVEVFPNLFVVCYTGEADSDPIVTLINPEQSEIEALMNNRLVGFNNRKYDNHILFGALLGYDNEALYSLSQRIISNSPGCYFGEAYNISYADIYDFSTKQQSLKKFEIELGIHHQELGLPWDQPVEEALWPKVAEYCGVDVSATRAVFKARHSDFVGRDILAKLAGRTPNETTRTLATTFMFGKNKNPQNDFNYRNMGEDDPTAKPLAINGYTDEYTLFNDKNQPIFPGYKFDRGKSYYRGEIVGEGGYVYAVPGVWRKVAVLDVASMHPSSIIAEQLFGEVYSKRFEDLVAARVAIKHGMVEILHTILDGALVPFLDGSVNLKDLSTALKLIINSVYGLTAATFDNPFKDPRNVDNIVAKRGALFMINLKHAVLSKGFEVVHIKTDSIKIPDATPEIIQFVSDYGKAYGYTFEHETTYDKMCLVNDAVYISKDSDGWNATGTQFAVPYVFKSLFSGEEITFDDLCETKSVSAGEIYIDMNEHLPDMSIFEKELDDRKKGRKKLNTLLEDFSNEMLEDKIAEGHSYNFVGRVGRFCPMVPGCGAGHLLRFKDGKYYAVTGSKGYLWMESEQVLALGLEDKIDRRYYDELVEKARGAIDAYEDYSVFNAS